MALSRHSSPQGTPLLDYLDRDRKEANPTRWEAAAQVPGSQFPGPAVDIEFDEARLTGLQLAVFNLMKDAKWRTHSEIKAAIGRGSENGIAAMLRNLRSPKRGRHAVNKRRRGDPTKGLYEYSLAVNKRSSLP